MAAFYQPVPAEVRPLPLADPPVGFPFPAGEPMPAGRCVYLNPVDGRVYLCATASGEPQVKSHVMGMTLNEALAIDQPVEVLAAGEVWLRDTNVDEQGPNTIYVGSAGSLIPRDLLSAGRWIAMIGWLRVDFKTLVLAPEWTDEQYIV